MDKVVVEERYYKNDKQIGIRKYQRGRH